MAGVDKKEHSTVWAHLFCFTQEWFAHIYMNACGDCERRKNKNNGEMSPRYSVSVFSVSHVG